MRHTINLDCKTHHISKDGTFPILLRVTLNGEQDYFNIGKRIKASDYDKVTKTVRKGIKGSGNYTSIIDIHKVKIRAIIDEFDKKGEIATICKVKDEYARQTGLSNSKSFHDFVTNQIALEKRNTKNKESTYKFIEKNQRNLKKYRPKLSIYDIDKKFIEEYKSYILKDLGHKENTAYHAMCFLRKYTIKLFKEGRISQNPFNDFVVGSPVEVDLVYLEPEELNILHDLYDSKKLESIIKVRKSKYARDFNIGIKLQEVLRYFLIACYTGFRHSDIKTLERSNIVGNIIVKKLYKSREGKEKTARIPIEKNFFSLLDMNNPNNLLFENPVMEDNQTNKYLELIMKEAGIKKHITFHKARYTFAVNSLILGMDIVTVSDILGHSEITTTQRYAKVVDTLRKQQMKKWSNFRISPKLDSNNVTVVCPTCEYNLFSLQKDVVKINKIPCVCSICNTEFLFELKG